YVDRQVSLRQRLEHAGRDAGTVRHAAQGNLRHVEVVGDAADAVELLHVYASVDQGARRLLEAGGDEDWYVVDRGDFHGPSLEDLRALAGELEHLFVSNLFQLARVGFDARVGRVDTIDVRVALAARTEHG